MSSLSEIMCRRVLHPQRPAEMGVQSDNENSIVLDVEIESKRALLTGDIEGDAHRTLAFWLTTCRYTRCTPSRK